MARILIVVNNLETLEDLTKLKKYFDIELAKTVIGLHYDAIFIKNDENCVGESIFCRKLDHNESIISALWSAILLGSEIVALTIFYNTLPIFTYNSYLLSELISSLVMASKDTDRELSIITRNLDESTVTIVVLSENLAGAAKVKLWDTRLANIIASVLITELKDILSRLLMEKSKLGIADSEKYKRILKEIMIATNYISSKLKM